MITKYSLDPKFIKEPSMSTVEFESQFDIHIAEKMVKEEEQQIVDAVVEMVKQTGGEDIIQKDPARVMKIIACTLAENYSDKMDELSRLRDLSTPKKTVDAFGDYPTDDYYCPKCKCFVQNSRDVRNIGAYDNCPWCGQALDWSDEE